MQKSTEERLANIENSITRLIKMQSCVFNLLQAQHKISMFMSETEWSMSSLKQSVESVSQNVGYALMFMFGSMTATGISLSMAALSSTTKDFLFGVLGIAFLALALVFFFLSFRYNRLAGGQRKATQRELLQAREQSQSVKEKAAAMDDALAQVLAEWKELVPNDLVSEPSNGTPETKNSHNRS